mgnify:CR=1 FL=1
MRRAIIAGLLHRRSRQSFECAAEVAFGIDQEVAVDHDAVAIVDAVHDLHVFRAAPAELDVTRFEPAVAQIDDDDLPAAAVDDRALSAPPPRSWSEPVAISTSAYMSGSSATSGLGSTMRTRAVRVSFIRCG